MAEIMNEGCICQSCGRVYKLDLMVTNEVWGKIKPEGKENEAGLLCGGCIVQRIEHMNGFSTYALMVRI